MNKTQEAFNTFLQTFAENGDVFGSSVLLESAASGGKIPQSHLTKIAKWTRTEQPVELIHTYPVLMIDTEPTRNKVIYTEKSQKKSIKRWAGITYLYNSLGTSGSFWSMGADHTLQAASQIARIYDAKAVKTPKGLIGSLGWFYAIEGIDGVTDSFIKKLDAGILREVSIHVSVPDGVLCSICNDAFSKCKDNSGDYHYPGEKYGKDYCYMSTGEGILIPLELSSVACPGSVNAHVMQDDEVDDYPVVSLKEALGGAREVIKTIHRENNVKKTREQVAAELKKVQEMAAEAGVTLAEAAETAGVELTERKKECKECGHSVKECTECSHEDHHDGNECRESGCECGKGEECGNSECECGKGAESSEDEEDDEANDNDDDDKKSKKNSDGPEDDDKKTGKAKKQSSNIKYPLFEGDCVACGRTESGTYTGTESEKIAAMRKDFQEQVTTIVEKAKSKSDELRAEVAAFKEKAAQFDLLFEDYIAETVRLAIEGGFKKSAEQVDYHKSLKALSYEAVREIRSAYTAKPVSSEAAKTKLVQTMEERAKANLGATRVVTDDSGKHKTNNDRRPKFAAK